MDSFNLKNLISLGFLFPFLVILGIEFLLGIGLDAYNQKIESDITNLEAILVQKEENLDQILASNEAFYVFSQAVNVVEIIKNRRSLNFVIDKFNKIMPTFLILKSFDFDSEENTISINGAVTSWADYVRFHSYVTHLPDLELKSFQSPTLDEKDNLIKFSMVFLLKPSFYK